MISPSAPSCTELNSNGQKDVLGRTYQRHAKITTTQNGNRIVITICNLALDIPTDPDIPASLKDPLITDSVDGIGGTQVTYLSSMVSSTIMHEIVHAVSLDSNNKMEILDLPDKASAYGWDNIFKNDESTAAKNADNYTFLGIWAGLAELGYTLPRIKGDALEIVKQALENYTLQGRIDAHSDITRRSLTMIAKRFTA